MAVLPAYADWLRSPALIATQAVTSPWGALAIDSKIVSPIAFKADADAEAARQLAFLAPPRVVDTLQVAGRRVDLVGKVVNLTADHEGYRSGALVFVISAAEQVDDNSTMLDVIRRLA